MSAPGPFELASQNIGCLPVLNHFLARSGLAGHLERHLPGDDARLRLDPAMVIGLVVRNIVMAHRPVYAIGEWAAGYEPCSGSPAPRRVCSTTTGSGARWIACSTPTGPPW